jgi:hypothetical protein
LEDAVVIRSGRRGDRRRHVLFLAALHAGWPRVRPDQLYILHPLVVCDKRAKYVGILRQSRREGKKKWEHVPPSCSVATRGRHGDRSPVLVLSNFFLSPHSGKTDLSKHSQQKKRTRLGSPPEIGHVRLLAAGLHIISA